MTARPGAQGMLSIGDAITVLTMLDLADEVRARQAFRLLGYRLAPRLAPYGVSRAGEAPHERMPLALDGGATGLTDFEPPSQGQQPAPPDLENEPPATDLPPHRRAAFEDLEPGSADLPEVDLLEPDKDSAPPRKRSLFQPRYEARILRDLCLVPSRSDQLDIGALTMALATCTPVQEVPRLHFLRPAAHVQLWLDVGEPMQVFEGDLLHLERRLVRRLAGVSRVTTGRWVGLPEPSRRGPPARSGTLAPAPGQRVLIASDLGVGGDTAVRLAPKEGAAARLAAESTFSKIDQWLRLCTSVGAELSILAPLSARRWSQTLPSSARRIEWSRAARPGTSVLAGSPPRRQDRRKLAALQPSPQPKRLARACALSVRITPALLRELRLRLLPHLGPETEAELWSGSLMQDASTQSASLLPDAASTLRDQLPGYHRLIGWLRARKALRPHEQKVLHPRKTIDDSVDALWPGKALIRRPRMVPAQWAEAKSALRAVLSRDGLLEQAVLRFPGWKEELQYFGRGHGILLAEEIRQISLRHASAQAHLSFEEALIWHAFNASRGYDSSVVRAGALVEALSAQLTLRTPAGRRTRDWVRRRHADLPQWVHEHAAYQRIVQLAGAAGGPAATLQSYQPIDIYVVCERSQLLLSPLPLADAWRIRADTRQGVASIRIGASSAAIRLDRPRRMMLPDGERDIPLQTLLGSIYLLPSTQEPQQPRGASFWLQHAAEEKRRCDWVAVMRWAARAADAADATPAEILQGTIEFSLAARLADLRVAQALKRITAFENRFASSDPLRAAGCEPPGLLTLALARVELLMLDSQLGNAIREARRTLDAVAREARAAPDAGQARGSKSDLAVMVSSAFADLAGHRSALLEEIHRHGLLPISKGLSGRLRTDADILDSSLEMVRDSAAYIGIVSHQYGHVPAVSGRNPRGLSISELEFNEAVRLNLPILLFVMKHPSTGSDIEVNPDGPAKLGAFRERARRWQEGGGLDRACEEFSSPEDFWVKAAGAIPRLKAFLEIQSRDTQTTPSSTVPPAPLESLAGRLRCRLVEALLRQGVWRDAREVLAGFDDTQPIRGAQPPAHARSKLILISHSSRMTPAETASYNALLALLAKNGFPRDGSPGSRGQLLTANNIGDAADSAIIFCTREFSTQEMSEWLLTEASVLAQRRHAGSLRRQLVICCGFPFKDHPLFELESLHLGEIEVLELAGADDTRNLQRAVDAVINLGDGTEPSQPRAHTEAGGDAASAVVQAWNAVALADYAFHRGIRADARRAWWALERARDSGDPALAFELSFARAFIEGMIKPTEAVNKHLDHALEQALRIADQPAIRHATLRLARHKLNDGAESEATRLLRPLLGAIHRIRSQWDVWRIYHEHAYQLVQRGQAGAVEPAHREYEALPEEELSRRAYALYSLTRAESAASRSATRAEAIRLFAYTGQLGKFVASAADMAFDDSAGWVRELLQKELGGTTPEVSLRRAVTKIGAGYSATKILGDLALHMEDDSQAERVLGRAFRMASVLGKPVYASVALTAAKRYRDRIAREPEPETVSTSPLAAAALHWLNKAVAMLEEGHRGPTRTVDLCLWQVYFNYHLGADADARQCGERALKLARQLDLDVERVTALMQLSFLARRRGDHLEASKALHQAHTEWAATESRRRVLAASRDRIADAHPMADHGAGIMFLDTLETFGRATTEALAPSELAFGDDLQWFANDFYAPKLLLDQHDYIKDFLYATEQLKGIAAPNTLAAWDLLIQAQQTKAPGSSRLHAFQRERDALARLPDGISGAEDDKGADAGVDAE
jgi:hypothetical protein